MAYTTIEAVKGYLGIPDANTSEDPLLEALIVQAQSIINGRTGRIFEAPTDTTRWFNPRLDCDNHRRTLFVDQDLISITSILNGDGLTIDPSNYFLVPVNESPKYGVRLRYNSDTAWIWTVDDLNAIAITGRWAYSITAPDDIARAAVRLTTYFYRQKDNAGEFQRKILAGNSTLIPSQLPRDFDEVLIPYIRYS